MFGFIDKIMGGGGGKGDFEPPPGPPPPPAPTSAPAPSPQFFPSSRLPAADAAAFRAEEGVQEEVVAAPSAPAPSSENAMIRSHLRSLQAAVAAKKAKKMAKVKAVQALHAKQAAYGRDTTQKRARKAGYATESEKLMGGRTGYGSYSPYGNFGQAVQQASDEVTKATRVVEQVTKDVKKGMATRSELEAAMADLDAKVKAAEALGHQASALKGYGEEEKGINPFIILIAIGALYFFFLRPA
jgi:hypothetical protein